MSTSFARWALAVQRRLCGQPAVGRDVCHFAELRLGATELEALRALRAVITPENAMMALLEVLRLSPGHPSASLVAIISANRWVAGLDSLRFAPSLPPGALPGAAALQLIDGLLALDDVLADARRDALAGMPP